MAADGTAMMSETRAERLARLLREAETAEAEAEAAVSPEDAEEHALIERAEIARQKKREALASARAADISQKVAEFKASAKGGYAVASFDLEPDCEGAGAFILRSPSPDAWTKFQDAVQAANGNNEKVARAYNNLCGATILWPEHTTDEWESLKKKFPALTLTLGEEAGRLGGIARTARKR